MFRKYWWIALLILALGSGVFFKEEIAQIARQIFTRGERMVKKWPYNKATGVVEADPQSLANEAGVNLDIFALAAMLSSEHGNDPQVYKEAIAHAALNEAKARGKSISSLLLQAVNPKHSGKFGSQADIEGGAPFKSDRYASTAQVPYDDDIGIALFAWEGYTVDPTEGARQFDSPKAQDALYAKGKYSLNAELLGAKRIKEGKREVNPEGIDPRRLRFWTVA